MIPILLSLVALVAFAILDTYASLNIALIVTITITIIEIIYTMIAFGTLDNISLFSFALVFALIGLSKLKNNRTLFKLKPAILNAGLGLYLMGSFAIGHPLLQTIANKYQHLLPQQHHAILMSPQGQSLLIQLTLTMGICLICHGIIVAYSGIKLHNFWWAAINSIGLLMAMGLASLAAIITL